MAAWFNKKKDKTTAQIAESLKAESLARAEAEEKLRAELECKAAMERKVKAEAEKMLLDQYNKYSALVEKAKAEAKEAMAKAGAQTEEAEEKVHYYAAALAQAEEKLSEAQERIKIEAIARVRAEERLKSENEERQRIEAQLEDALTSTQAKEEAKVHSQEAAVTNAQEKLQSNEAVSAKTQENRIEAEGQVSAKVAAKVKECPKAGIKESQRLKKQPVDGVHSGKRNYRDVFHPGNIKRKIILLLVLVIFSALAFALNIGQKPSVTEPNGAKNQIPVPGSSSGSDTDREHLKSDMSADISGGSLAEPATNMTNAPAFNYGSKDDVTLKVNEGMSVPVLNVQSSTLTANPVPLKLTAPTGGTNNLVQFSDNKRWITRAGSNISYEFSDISIGGNTVISSVVLFVEHFEEERFAEGKLEWSIGTGWPVRPVVWAIIKAPVHEGESREAVDAWDITSVVNTAEKINSLQLQIKNNNNVANGKTFVDYAYVVIEYD
jgi:hypothetical protein